MIKILAHMTAISIVNYMHELKQAGFTDKQSEVQARQFEKIVSEVKSESVTRQDLEATKKQLELAIEKLRYETLKFVVWTDIGVVITLAGLLAKGFHWF
jgi:hypothetical protein